MSHTHMYRPIYNNNNNIAFICKKGGINGEIALIL